MLYPRSSFASPAFGQSGGELVLLMPDGTVMSAAELWRLGNYAAQSVFTLMAPVYIGATAAPYGGMPSGLVNVDEAPARLINGNHSNWGPLGEWYDYRGPVAPGGWGGDNISIVPLADAHSYQRYGVLPEVLGNVRDVDAFGRLTIVGADAPPPLAVAYVAVDTGGVGPGNSWADQMGLVFPKGAGLAKGDGVVAYDTGDAIIKMCTTTTVNAFGALAAPTAVRLGAIQWVLTPDTLSVGQRVSAEGTSGRVIAWDDEGELPYIGIALTRSIPGDNDEDGSSVPTVCIQLFDFAQPGDE